MSMEYSSGARESSFMNMNPFILPLVKEPASPSGTANEQVLPLMKVILSANSFMASWLFLSMFWSQLKLAP